MITQGYQTIRYWAILPLSGYRTRYSEKGSKMISKRIFLGFNTPFLIEKIHKNV